MQKSTYLTSDSIFMIDKEKLNEEKCLFEEKKIE